MVQTSLVVLLGGVSRHHSDRVYVRYSCVRHPSRLELLDAKRKGWDRWGLAGLDDHEENFLDKEIVIFMELGPKV